uniref:Uncharacterized protein n=1 Tax=Anopheles melas TaxID=34690 RepID=A0A182TXZ0_9DIPT
MPGLYLMRWHLILRYVKVGNCRSQKQHRIPLEQCQRFAGSDSPAAGKNSTAFRSNSANDSQAARNSHIRSGLFRLYLSQWFHLGRHQVLCVPLQSTVYQLRLHLQHLLLFLLLAHAVLTAGQQSTFGFLDFRQAKFAVCNFCHRSRPWRRYSFRGRALLLLLLLLLNFHRFTALRLQQLCFLLCFQLLQQLFLFRQLTLLLLLLLLFHLFLALLFLHLFFHDDEFALLLAGNRYLAVAGPTRS